MKPKEKAKELIQKHLNYFGKNSDEVEEYKAKQCALVTVDEILSEYRGYRIKSAITLESAKQLCKYWEKVQKHIEK